MVTSLKELAELVQGQLVGDGSTTIHGAAALQDAMAGEISFLEKADKAQLLENTKASALVVPLNFQPEGPWPVIQVAEVSQAFTQIVLHFRPARPQTRSGIHPRAVVSPKAVLGADVDIHALATVDDDVHLGEGCTIHSGVHLMAGCRIGDHVTIFPGAVLYEGTIVGSRCIIHAGVMLGCYGFGYRVVEGKHQRGAQFGHVEVGADVEIGANTAIDRGCYGPTVIGDGTKIDNLVQIGHNCRLGRHNIICSQVGIAGSTTTGDYVVMAGQVGLADHIHLGTGAVIGAKSGVSKDVPENARVLGIPAIPERDQKLLFAALSKLPEMRKQLKKVLLQLNIAEDMPQRKAG